jgi:hypothetical protein
VAKSTDAPLNAKIEGDQLVIRIGIDTLAFAAEHCPRFYDNEKNPDPPFIKVTDKRELALDVVCALLHEQEDGTTPLCILLDDAFEYAYGDGSLGFYDDEA